MCEYTDIFQEVLLKHNNPTKWDGSKFGKIKIVSNTKVGSVGQDFIERLCVEIGFKVEFPLNNNGARATQSPWDIKINDVEFELKTASEDVSESFQFNHIRYHRTYDAVLCLGVSPNELYFNLWSKAGISTGKAGRLVSMEKGANASYKLTKRSKDLFSISLFKDKITKFTLDFNMD